MIQSFGNFHNENKLYIMRDDLIPYSFGGNKARKAKLFFEDIENKGSDSVVTYGSSSSNHCRIIANLAASKKLPCYIITPNQTQVSTFNNTLLRWFGTSIIPCSINNVKDTIEEVLAGLQLKGLNPYLIEGGGHGNIGTRAYVNAFDEIIDYEKKENIKFDYIFHASGTGTTQAGLICGKLINKSNVNVIGISIARKNPRGKLVVLESVNSFLNSLSIEGIVEDDVFFTDKYILNGYGTFNDHIVRKAKEVMINFGIPLDYTYTGKAFWGMEEYIKENVIKEKKMLFIHTGGTPIFFDNLEVF